MGANNSSPPAPFNPLEDGTLPEYTGAEREKSSPRLRAGGARCSTPPAQFDSSRHGTLIKLSETYSVAERMTPEKSWKNGVVYTAQKVSVGKMWKITVLSTNGLWSGGLVSSRMLCSMYFQKTVYEVQLMHMQACTA